MKLGFGELAREDQDRLRGAASSQVGPWFQVFQEDFGDTQFLRCRWCGVQARDDRAGWDAFKVHWCDEGESALRRATLGFVTEEQFDALDLSSLAALLSTL